MLARRGPPKARPRHARAARPRVWRGLRREASGGRSLGAQAGGALGWSFGNTLMAKLCTVAVGIALARLLGPHEFGTFAVASVALTIMTNVNDLGVSLAIVRWPGEPREITPTVTTISVLTSSALYVACYAGAPGYSAAMGAPAATGVVRVLSLVILIDGFATAPIGLLQRNFRQDQRTVADQVNVWLGMLLTLVLALGGLGAMSLAIGRLAGCLAAVGLLVRFSPEPLRFGFNRRQARALLRFGLPLAGTGVIAFAIANVDQLVVGHLLGVTALGFFVLAANLSSWPSAAFSEPISQVAPAALARLQHDLPAMRASFETMLALVSAVTVPVCLVESGSAAPLIRIVYGVHWLPAHQPLIWLALLAALQIFFQLTLDYFVVLGRSRMLFTLQTVWLVALMPSLIVGARMRGGGRRCPRRAGHSGSPAASVVSRLAAQGRLARPVAGDTAGSSPAGGRRRRGRRRRGRRSSAQRLAGPALRGPGWPPRHRLAPAAHAECSRQLAAAIQGGRDRRGRWAGDRVP